MRIYAPFSAAVRVGARALMLALICAVCLFSTLTLQTAPAAYAVCRPGGASVDQPANCNQSSSSQSTSSSTTTYPLVHVYASDVAVHYNDSTHCPKPLLSCPVQDGDYIGPGNFQAKCQARGDLVYDASVGVPEDQANQWWTLLQVPTSGHWGWITNVYISGGAIIKGIHNENVPECGTTTSTPKPPSPPKPVLCSAQYFDSVTTTKQSVTGGTQYTVKVPGTSSIGAAGCATFTFSKTHLNQLTDIIEVVKDTAGDSHAVFIQFLIYDSQGVIARLRNDSTGPKRGTPLQFPIMNYTHQGHNITGVTVEACTNVQGGDDQCNASAYIKNP